MRLAALSDIHGNLPALDAVLDDITRARDELSCGHVTLNDVGQNDFEFTGRQGHGPG